MLNDADIGGDCDNDCLDNAYDQDGDPRLSRNKLFGVITTPRSDVELLVGCQEVGPSIGFVNVKMEEPVNVASDVSNTVFSVS